MFPESFEELVRGASVRPGMYIGSLRIDCYLAFIEGYAWALKFESLDGLAEWLGLRLDVSAMNVRWSHLLLVAAGATEVIAAGGLDRLPPLTQARHLELIAKAGELILAFLADKSSLGLDVIKTRYRERRFTKNSSGF